MQPTSLSEADACTWLPHGVRLSTADHATVLDAALAAGLSVPFSCQRGVCGSCTVEVVDGQHVSSAAALDAFDPGPGRMLMCQSRACGELVVRVPDFLPQRMPVKRAMRVLVKKAWASDVMGLTLDTDGRLQTQAGQHVRIALGNSDYRCFSIANHRDDDEAPIELQIRRVAGGQFSDVLLGALAEGDVLEVEGPFGLATQALPPAPLVLLATGTGYAGVRALLQSALANPAVPSVALYWAGRHAADHYAQAELQAWQATDPRLQWTAVYPETTKGHAGQDSALQRHVQDHALAEEHDWTATQVHACGNPAMLRDARLALLAAGLPATHWHADAFVPSGRGIETHAWERTGLHFDRAGIIAARERSIAAVHDIAAHMVPGITAAEARALADARLQALGSQRTWHSTIVRFGADTVCTSREGGDLNRRLQDSDILFIDIGPVWDGYEGDYGDTFVMGSNPAYQQCAQAARAVFEEAAAAWRDGATGVALYALADAAAKRHGCTLVHEMPGHRIADFPHALYGRHQLAQAGFAPSEGLWVLEIQLRHSELAIGAFFEDVLLREAP